MSDLTRYIVESDFRIFMAILSVTRKSVGLEEQTQRLALYPVTLDTIARGSHTASAEEMCCRRSGCLSSLSNLDGPKITFQVFV